MKFLIKNSIFLCLLIMLTGCGAMYGPKLIYIDSKPQGAYVKINDVSYGITPLVLNFHDIKLSREDEDKSPNYSVPLVLSKEGYQSKRLLIQTERNYAVVALDVLAIPIYGAGIIALAVDAANNNLIQIPENKSHLYAELKKDTKNTNLNEAKEETNKYFAVSFNIEKNGNVSGVYLNKEEELREEECINYVAGEALYDIADNGSYNSYLGSGTTSNKDYYKRYACLSSSKIKKNIPNFTSDYLYEYSIEQNKENVGNFFKNINFIDATSSTINIRNLREYNVFPLNDNEENANILTKYMNNKVLNTTFKASFSCVNHKNLAKNELRICINESLANLDNKLASYYSKTLKKYKNTNKNLYKSIIASQKQWVKDSQNSNTMNDLMQSYNNRLDYLYKLNSNCLKAKDAIYLIDVNQEQAINDLSDCVNGDKVEEDTNSYDDTSKIFLAYIYLANDKYRNVEKANSLIKEALVSLLSDCLDNSSSNFCQTFHKDDLKKKYNTQEDIFPLMIVQLKNIPANIVVHNPKILDAYNEVSFGGSRDVSLARIKFEKNGKYKFIDAFSLRDVKGYEDFSKLIKEKYNYEENDGTIIFTEHLFSYLYIVSLSLFPNEEVKKLNEDYYRYYYSEESDDSYTKVYFSEVEQILNNYPELKQAYNNLIKDTTDYFTNNLGIDKEIAAEYATKAVRRIFLITVFM